MSAWNENRADRQFRDNRGGTATATHSRLDPDSARLVADLETRLRTLTESYDTADRLIMPWERFMNGGQLLFPSGYPTDRKAGRNWPIITTEVDLRQARSFCRLIGDTNPLVIAFLDHVTNFVVKTGFKWQVTLKGQAKSSPHGMQADPDVERVQQVLDEFRQINGWGDNECFTFGDSDDSDEDDTDPQSNMEHEGWRRAMRDGEFFLRLFRGGPETNGIATCRVIEPECVESPDGSQGPWSWGILTDPADRRRRRAYHVIDQDADDTTGENVPANRVVHLKLNVDADVKRGLPDFWPLQDEVQRAQKLWKNMAEVGAILAAIAYIRQHAPNVTGTQVNNMLAQRSTDGPLLRPPGWGPSPYAPDRGTDRTNLYTASTPGQVIDVSNGMQYVPPPSATGVAAFTETLQAVFRIVGIRWGCPEYFSGSAENANFASTLVAGGPFEIACVTRQGHYKRFQGRLAKRVIDLAVESRRLTSEQRVRVEIKIVPPAVAIANRMEDTQRRSTLNQAKVLSPQTWAMEEGYDPDQEAANFAAFDKAQAAAQQPAAGPGGPGGPGGPDGPDAGLGGGGPQPASPDVGGGGGGDAGEQPMDLATLLGESGIEAKIDGVSLSESRTRLLNEIDPPDGFLPDGLAFYVLAEHGPPPHPGWVWKDSTKRWTHPHTGEEHPDEAALPSPEAKTNPIPKFPDSSAEVRYLRSAPYQRAEDDELAAELLGDSDAETIANAVGAPDDAVVKFMRITRTAYGQQVAALEIRVEHPDFEAVHYVQRNPKTNEVYVKIEDLRVNEDKQGSGITSVMFSSQASHLSRMGVAYVTCHAAAEDDAGERTFGGYYTWPRFGFDQPLDPSKGWETDGLSAVIEKANELFPEAKTVLGLMSTREGQQWWKANGVGMRTARFDLSDGSRSMAVLAAYLDERAKRKESLSRPLPPKTKRPSMPSGTASTPHPPPSEPLAEEKANLVPKKITDKRGVTTTRMVDPNADEPSSPRIPSSPDVSAAGSNAPAGYDEHAAKTEIAAMPGLSDADRSGLLGAVKSLYGAGAKAVRIAKAVASAMHDEAKLWTTRLAAAGLTYADAMPDQDELANPLKSNAATGIPAAGFLSRKVVGPLAAFAVLKVKSMLAGKKTTAEAVDEPTPVPAEGGDRESVLRDFRAAMVEAFRKAIESADAESDADAGGDGTPSPDVPQSADSESSDDITDAGLVALAMTKAKLAGDDEAIDNLAAVADDPAALQHLLDELAIEMHGGHVRESKVSEAAAKKPPRTGPPGPPPKGRTGLVWKEATKRWVRDPSTVPTKKPKGAAADQSAAPGTASPDVPGGIPAAAPAAKKPRAPRKKADTSTAKDAVTAALADPSSIQPEQLGELAGHLKAMSVADLKGHLKGIKSKVSGAKAELVDRLLAHVGSKAVPAGGGDMRHNPDLDAMFADDTPAPAANKGDDSTMRDNGPSLFDDEPAAPAKPADKPKAEPKAKSAAAKPDITAHSDNELRAEFERRFGKPAEPARVPPASRPVPAKPKASAELPEYLTPLVDELSVLGEKAKTAGAVSNEDIDDIMSRIDKAGLSGEQMKALAMKFAGVKEGTRHKAMLAIKGRLSAYNRGLEGQKA